MKKYREEKEIIYLIKLNQVLSSEGIDKDFQKQLKLVKEEVEAGELKEFNQDVYNLQIRTSIKGLINLYKSNQITFDDFYQRQIKVIGYDFMCHELLSRLIKEDMISDEDKEKAQEILNKLCFDKVTKEHQVIKYYPTPTDEIYKLLLSGELEQAFSNYLKLSNEEINK